MGQAGSTVSRRRFLKYGVTGVIVVVAVGAAAFYALSQPSKTPISSSSSSSSSGIAPITSSSSPSSSASSAVPLRGGTIRITSTGGSPNLDNNTNTTPTTFAVSQSVLSDLVRPNPDLALVADLATSWDISSDATQYTFNLRKGVKFHDGSDFDANVAKWNFDRMVDPATKSVLAGYVGTGFTTQALDQYTLKITFQNPDGLFITRFYFPPAPRIHSQAAIQQYGSDYGIKALVGTGPFKLVSFDPNTSECRLARNPDYYVEGLPYLDGVSFSVQADAETRDITLRGGQTDLVWDLQVSDLPALQSDQTVKTYTFLVAGGERVILATRKPPFDDKRVRQAFSQAIDREAINTAVYQGKAQAAFRMIPPTIKDYFVNEKLSNFAYNPTKARSLLDNYLKDTGKTNDDLTISIISVPTNGDSRLWAPLVQANLATINWKMNIVTMDSSGASKRSTAPYGQHDIMHGYCTRNVPASDIVGFFNFFPNNANISDYSSPSMDGLLKQFTATTTVSDRANVVNQMEQLNNEDMIHAYLIWPLEIYASSKKVNGFVPVPLFTSAFADSVWLSA